MPDAITTNSPEGVSICMPTRNGEKFLREALASAVAQTHPNLEILVIDDASTDGTLAVVKEFQKQYAVVRLVQNPSPLGLVGNWTKAVESASHPWVKFLFQDDILEKDCVATMLNLCRQYQASLALCARRFLADANASPATLRYLETVPKPEDIFGEGYVSGEALAKAAAAHGLDNVLGEPVCLLFHHDLFRKVGGFDNRLAQLVDFDFALRAGLQAGLAFTPQPLVSFRVHAASETAANTGVPDAKKIRADVGDQLLLLQRFLADEQYSVLRAAWPPRDLRHEMKFVYAKGLKRYGAAMPEALESLRNQLPDLKPEPFNRLLYQTIKWKRNAYLKKRKG